MIRSLQEHLARANLKLERRYTEPTPIYQQRDISADTAWLERNEIRLGPVLLLESQQEFIDEVMPHELARLLVWQHFGRVAPYGKEWKWTMGSALDVPARCTHHFEPDLVRQNTFPCRCRCQQHQLTTRRHSRVVRDEATYRHIHCGDPLIAEK